MIDQITTEAKKAETGLPTLARMCDLLEVSRSGYEQQHTTAALQAA